MAPASSHTPQHNNIARMHAPHDTHTHTKKRPRTNKKHMHAGHPSPVGCNTDDIKENTMSPPACCSQLLVSVPLFLPLQRHSNDQSVCRWTENCRKWDHFVAPPQNINVCGHRRSDSKHSEKNTTSQKEQLTHSHGMAGCLGPPCLSQNVDGDMQEKWIPAVEYSSKPS